MNYSDYPRLAAQARGDAPAQTVLKNGRVLNVFTGEIQQTDIAITDGSIIGVGSYRGITEIDLQGQYVVPGFIDAHLHFESTMVTPPQLIENAVAHGTTTYIADPHEAANVLGWAGIQFILDETEDVPANVYIMLPSCVPATAFEMSGCVFDALEMEKHSNHPRVIGLGEVMDYAGVIQGAPEMMRKLALFADRPRDGHAPELAAADLAAYVLAGISTDHECLTFADALRKRRMGMHIHIREGSAAKNLDVLVRGIVETGLDTSGFSFCTDDLHIEDVRRHGHIDQCVRRAIALGVPCADAYRMASTNSARVYGLSHLGAIAPGYQADLVVLRDLNKVDITAVYHRGQNTASFRAPACTVAADSPLRGTMRPTPQGALSLPATAAPQDVIGVISGQITTEHLHMVLPQKNGIFTPADGLNLLAVIERHHATGAVGLAALSGFSVRSGAIASSVSHDSHNLLVAGDNEADMLCAVEELTRIGGGYTIVQGGRVRATLPLPLMGLISDQPFENTERTLHEMIHMAHQMGVPAGVEPFITLSFLALPVIPSLRLTPRGLFDVERFSFI